MLQAASNICWTLLDGHSRSKGREVPEATRSGNRSKADLIEPRGSLLKVTGQIHVLEAPALATRSSYSYLI
jgi:hypothetical protein